MVRALVGAAGFGDLDDMVAARTAALVTLLVAALVLTGVLTWQAADAARSHRLAAERVVRDFAAIAADELLRRASGEIETYGFLPVRQAMLETLNEEWTLPALAAPASPDDRLARARPLVGQMFLVDARSNNVEPTSLDAPLRSWLAGEFFAAASARRKTGEQVLRVRHGASESLLSYGVAFSESGRLFGFVVDETGFGPFLERAFARRSVFPPSLGGGRLGNENIFIEVSRGGRVLFRSPGRYDPSVGVTRTLGDDYGEVFRGATVRSSIDPRAAPLLVVGGLPRSRLPLIVMVLVTTIGVLAAAVILLHREKQLAKLRSDFVSGVSHELRTPLTQIRMFAETLLMDRVRSDEERRRSLRIIDQEARRLAHLVDNVLLFSRGERGALETAVGDHDAAQIIRESVEHFAPIAASQNATVTTEVPEHLPVRIDRDGWKQVLLNLLENAVKYGPSGQTVQVRAFASNGSFRMEVEDEGPGIPPSERDAIWEKFVRLSRDRETHKAGTGIGLAVVKDVVALHGGRCWVENVPRGGARFVVEVPQ